MFKMNRGELPPKFPERSEIESLGSVDYGWSFYALDATEQSLRDYENKVVFITVWSTQCSVCQSLLPGIQRLYDSMRGENIIFVLLSRENRGTLQNFIETSGLTVPVYFYENELPVGLKIEETPTTFISDRHGSIVFKHVGAAKWDDLTTRIFLRELQQWR